MGGDLSKKAQEKELDSLIAIYGHKICVLPSTYPPSFTIPVKCSGFIDGHPDSVGCTFKIKFPVEYPKIPPDLSFADCTQNLDGNLAEISSHLNAIAEKNLGIPMCCALIGALQEEFNSISDGLVSEKIIKAMRIREKYMNRSMQYFPKTVQQFVLRTVLDAGVSQREFYRAPYDANMDEQPFQMDCPGSFGYRLTSDKGLVRIWNKNEEIFQQYHTTLAEFLRDFQYLNDLTKDGPSQLFCKNRLSNLNFKFQMHKVSNGEEECKEQKQMKRDFCNVQKVDTHVHAASAMTRKQLLDFMKDKLEKEGERLIYTCKTGKQMTLAEVFESFEVTSVKHLNVDLLDGLLELTDQKMFNRFDRFNLKYNPLGQNILREIFLKTDNFIDGRYFAEMLKLVMSSLEENEYNLAEYRLSIYGKDRYEWDNLAKWAINNSIHSPNVRWVIQIPCLYDVYKANKVVDSFQEMMENIFMPLFEVTNDPMSHPYLHKFLCYVVALDCVDDESKQETTMFDMKIPTADMWTSSDNPPYGYYIFHVYANLGVLNRFRAHRWFNTLSFRPHCGEAGPKYHLTVAFMAAESISHGLILRKSPVAQYLYYICKMGVAMSPLSNNGLFLKIAENPLPDYFAKGLNISISTDDPLQFHLMDKPLMEEYSVARAAFGLNLTDICEIAKNSVLQSGFPCEKKIFWLGSNFFEFCGNEILRTNLPDIRADFQAKTLIEELQTIFSHCPAIVPAQIN